MKIIGQNTKDYSMHYFDAGRVVRITRDETNPYWIEIYDDAVHKIFTDRNGDEIGSEYIQGSIKANKYDISLSRAPFGEAAKEREFNELMVLTEAALKLNRPDYVKFEYLVKNSRLREKDEWLEHIKLADQNQTQMLQQEMGKQAQVNKLAALKAGMEVKSQALDVAEKENEVKAENYLKENVAKSIQE